MFTLLNNVLLDIAVSNCHMFIRSPCAYVVLLDYVLHSL